MGTKGYRNIAKSGVKAAAARRKQAVAKKSAKLRAKKTAKVRERTAMQRTDPLSRDDHKRIEVLGVIEIGEGPQPHIGWCRLLGVQLEWLSPEAAAGLTLKRTTVETPDGDKSEWLVFCAESHCGLRIVTLVDATPADVFAGCFVHL